MEYTENELPKYYKILFNAVEKALFEIGQHNYGTAASLLSNGQIQAESAFIDESLKRDGIEESTDSGETVPEASSED